ncbi:hypothetical protein MC885_013698, partial [Smutsia gigantea]
AWRREHGPNQRTPQAPGVAREGPATCASPQEGLRPLQHLGQRREGGAKAPSSAHAHSAGARLSGWRVRAAIRAGSTEGPGAAPVLPLLRVAGRLAEGGPPARAFQKEEGKWGRRARQYL